MVLGLAAEGKALLVSSHILSELGEMCDCLGIIERGQLIASGTVAEIRSRLQPHIDIRVQAVSGADVVAKWLGVQPNIRNVVLVDQLVRFQVINGDKEKESELALLLRAMIEQGFQISEFATEGRTLEDVFMQITTGAVQ
jgi:ABC-2 type transport system ATP-binding protein